MDENNPQATATPADNGGEQTPANTPADPKGAEQKPFKTFATQEEFDRHSAGILNNAQKKAEKELLSLLGLKPDEKDKLAKFKEAYDATLSDAEKQKKEMETLAAENGRLKERSAELEAVISALGKSTGRKADDVTKYVKMARGLVDENTTIEQALEQVLAMAGTPGQEQKKTPQGTPPGNQQQQPEENPFKTGNLTAQGRLFKDDPQKARSLYEQAHGKKAPW